MNIQKTVRELSSSSFSVMTSDEWTLSRKLPQDWTHFAASWDRLAADLYMKSGDTYRQRRFCKYIVDTSSMSFEELDDFVFYQPATLNSYAGNLRREFAPVEPDIRKSKLLRAIIKRCLAAILLCERAPTPVWRVYVHQIRINCSTSLTGRPTPEGLHRDGHDYISMHLMDRVRIEGGTSSICDKHGRPLRAVTLAYRLDGFLVNDREVLHGVSPITPSTAEAGHRDMLIIDYNREG